jgi:hypothetical protein
MICAGNLNRRNSYPHADDGALIEHYCQAKQMWLYGNAVLQATQEPTPKKLRIPHMNLELGADSSDFLGFP